MYIRTLFWDRQIAGLALTVPNEGRFGAILVQVFWPRSQMKDAIGLIWDRVLNFRFPFCEFFGRRLAIVFKRCQPICARLAGFPIE